MTYPSLTDNEIKEVARRAVTNEIVFACTEEAIEGCFGMLIALMTDEQAERLKSDRIAAVWEEYSKAAPRAVNGQPVFFSGHFVDVDDTNKIVDEIQRMQEALGINEPEPKKKLSVPCSSDVNISSIPHHKECRMKGCECSCHERVRNEDVLLELPDLTEEEWNRGAEEYLKEAIKIVAHRPDPKEHPRLAAEFEADHQKCIASGHTFDESGICMWCGDDEEEYGWQQTQPE